MHDRIRHPDTFREIINDFEGIPITIRDYYADGIFLIKLDDGFARANGFPSMEDVYRVSPRLRSFDWLDMAVLAAAETFLSRPVS